jgi:hypothetical protein
MALRRSLLLALLAFVGMTAAATPAQARIAGDQKRVCAYSAHRISTLQRLGDMLGHEFDCALVFNNASPDWWGWENPWFAREGDRDVNWAKWVKDGSGRDLIISQNLFPSELNGTDWLQRGAAGEFDEHARALASKLVAAGLGGTVIRLAHEMNGTWSPYFVGYTAAERRLWAAYWRRTALAMRSVPGADFTFDWCVNAAVLPLPLEEYWPGDDVVDIVGIDAYDSGVRAGLDRWKTIYERPLGIRDVLSFARAHGKPLSIPEWGLGPADKPSLLAGGDNPAYVEGIGRVIREERSAYQSYFFTREFATQLEQSPLSQAAYRTAFVNEAQAPAERAQAPASPRPAKPGPRAERLNLRISGRRRARAGRRVALRFRVLDARGRALPGAILRVAGKRRRTDRRGRVVLRVRLRARRIYTVRASLRGASARMRVRVN